MMTVLFINVFYIAICGFIMKLRNSNHPLIREWDNGYAFLETLSKEDSELYWHKDTQILQIFMLMFGIFLEICCILILMENDIIDIAFTILIGLVVSCSVAIISSIKLRREFKKKL